MIPAPMMFSEWAIWNWCAIKAPEEIPDTEIASLSMFNPLAKSVNGGGVACARRCQRKHEHQECGHGQDPLH